MQKEDKRNGLALLAKDYIDYGLIHLRWKWDSKLAVEDKNPET